MDISFSRELIKGKITESIFEEMFRLSGEFIVLPVGYEHTAPELAQYQHHLQIRQVLDNLRHAPDFALISQDKTKVFLVEVKYRHELEQKETLIIAQNIITRWNPCFLFIATKQGFYFDSCKNIIQNKGTIERLTENWINRECQNKYINLLREFITLKPKNYINQ